MASYLAIDIRLLLVILIIAYPYVVSPCTNRSEDKVRPEDNT